MSEFGPAVLETTATTGTGTLDLDGAGDGYATAVGAIGDGGSGFFTMRGNEGEADEDEWEDFYGTVTAGTPDTLTRNVLGSSNGGALVSWSAGTKTVYSMPQAGILNSMLTGNAATSRPPWLPPGATWTDTDATPYLVKYWDGTDDTVLGEINATTNKFTPYFEAALLTFAALAGNLAYDSTDRLSGHGTQVNEQTGTSYTLTQSDNGTVVRLTNAAAITLTVPQESTEDLTDGFQCALIQGGAGQVTVAKEGSDTIESKDSNLKISAQHAAITVIKRSGGAPSTWWIGGDLSS